MTAISKNIVFCFLAVLLISGVSAVDNDDFERVDPLTDYSGDTGKYTVVSSPAIGSQSLSANGGSTADLITSQSVVPFSQGETLNTRLRFSSSGKDNANILFGVQDSDNFYMVNPVDDDGSGEDILSIFKRSGGSYNNIGKTTYNNTAFVNDEFLNVSIEWQTDGTIDATVYDDGFEVASTQATDSEFTSGGTGYRSIEGLVQYDAGSISTNNDPSLSNPSPADGATVDDEFASLSLDYADADGDTGYVEFYNASDDSLIENVTSISNGSTASTSSISLEKGSTVEWYAEAYDGNGGSTTSSTYSFKVPIDNDNFERSNPLSDYSGDTGQYSIVSNPSIGSKALEASGGSSTDVITSQSAVDFSQGQAMNTELRFNSSGKDNANILFGVQDSDNFYMVNPVDDDGFGNDVLSIWKNSGGSFTNLKKVQVDNSTYPSNKFFNVSIDWSSDGTITATAYDSGSELASVQASDSSYSSGGTGFRSIEGLVQYDAEGVISKPVLNDPADGKISDTPINFTYLPNIGSVDSCSIYTNETGSWASRETDSSVVSGSENSFLRDFNSENIVKWGVSCSDSTETLFSNNRTVKADLAPTFQNTASNLSTIDVGESIQLSTDIKDKFEIQEGFLSTNASGTFKNYTGFSTVDDVYNRFIDNKGMSDAVDQGVDVGGGWTKNPSNPVLDDRGGWTRHEQPYIVQYNRSTFYMFLEATKDGSPNYNWIALKSNDLESWTLLDNEVVWNLSESDVGSWADDGLAQPHPIKYNSTHWVAYMGGRTSDNIYSIGGAITTDEEFPYGWNELDNSPFFTPSDVSNAEPVAAAPSVKNVNGTYHMYYEIFGSNYDTGATNLATSPNGIDNWTQYSGNPVVDNGGTGDWDENFANNPSVVYNGTHCVLAYAGGVDNQGTGGMGLATSSNCKDFNKYSGNPVITTDVEWEDAITGGHFYKHPQNDRLYYWYQDEEFSGDGFDIGFAYQNDYNWNVFDSPDKSVKADNSFNPLSFDWSNSSVPDGTTVAWKIYGKGSTSSTQTNTFTVTSDDTSAPSISINSPVEGQTYSTSSIDLNVKSSENLTISTWEYNLDNTGNTSFTPNTTLTGLSEGGHDLTVYGTDSNGTAYSDSVSFTVDISKVQINGNVQINQTGHSNHNTFINVTDSFTVSGIDVYGTKTGFGGINWTLTGNKTDRIVAELSYFSDNSTVGDYMANYSVISGLSNQIKSSFEGVTNDVFHINKDGSFYSQQSVSSNFFDFNYTTNDAQFTDFTVQKADNFYPEITGLEYVLDQPNNLEEFNFSLDDFGEKHISSSNGAGVQSSISNSSMIYDIALPIFSTYNVSDDTGLTSAGFEVDLNKSDSGLKENESFDHTFSSQATFQEINLTNNADNTVDYNVTNEISTTFTGSVGSNSVKSLSDGNTGDFVNEQIGNFTITDSEVVLGFNYTGIYPLQANNTASVGFTGLETGGLYTEESVCDTVNNTAVDVNGNTDHDFDIGQTCNPGSIGSPTQDIVNISDDKERIWYNSTDMSIASNLTSNTNIVVRADKSNLKNPDNRDGGSLKAIVEGVDSSNSDGLNVSDTGSFFRITVGDIQASTLYTDDSDWSVTYTLIGEDTEVVNGGGGGGGSGPDSESQIIFFGNDETSEGLESVSVPFGASTIQNMTVTNERQSSVSVRVSVGSGGVCEYISVQRTQQSDQFSSSGSYDIGAATQELGTVENTESFEIKYDLPTREKLQEAGVSDFSCEFSTSSSYGTAEPLVLNVGQGFSVDFLLDFLQTEYCFEVPLGEAGSELTNVEGNSLEFCVVVWQLVAFLGVLFVGGVVYSRN